MFIHRLMVKGRAALWAYGAQLWYGWRVAGLADNELVRYICAVTEDISWDHWKESVTATNTDVRSIVRCALAYPAGSTFIEIGSWMGRTTCALGLTLRIKGGGSVLAVDDFAGDSKHMSQHRFVQEKLGGNYFALFWRNIQKFRLTSIVVPIKELSAAALPQVMAQLGGRKCQLLFIDGDHTAAGVRADVRGYVPLVALGGTVVFDDFNDAAVARAAADIHTLGQWEQRLLNGGKQAMFRRLA
jgi:hypothetical protein